MNADQGHQDSEHQPSDVHSLESSSKPAAALGLSTLEVLKAAPGPQDDLLHLLRGATSTGRTPTPRELEAMSLTLDRITLDKYFQAAMQRYAHGNGSSRAVAQAAIAAIAEGRKP